MVSKNQLWFWKWHTTPSKVPGRSRMRKQKDSKNQKSWRRTVKVHVLDTATAITATGVTCAGPIQGWPCYGQLRAEDGLPSPPLLCWTIGRFWARGTSLASAVYPLRGPEALVCSSKARVQTQPYIRLSELPQKDMSVGTCSVGRG